MSECRYCRMKLPVFSGWHFAGENPIARCSGRSESRRPAIPGRQPHRDRKNDYRRAPKHRGRIEGEV